MSGYGNYYDEPKQGAAKRYKGHEYSAYSPIRGFWSAIITGPYARSHGEIEARSQAQALQYAREVIDEEIAKATQSRFDSAIERIHTLDARLRKVG